MNIETGKKSLITADNWFYAPDGKQYRAVFGTVKSIKTAEETLGIKPNGRSTNWYVEIGNMTIAGCQIHYAIRTDECNLDRAGDWTTKNDVGVTEFDTPSKIYFAD